MVYNNFMKVLFLDIDGVLNSVAYSQTKVSRREYLIADPSSLDPEAGQLLGAWLKANLDVVVVISSTWRKRVPMAELQQMLADIGLPIERIIDYTPIIHNVVRGEEIKAWLQGQMLKSNFAVTGIAILDDDADMASLMPYLVQTDLEVGLTVEDLKKLSDCFKLPMPKIS
jgi:hypothetical protein